MCLIALAWRAHPTWELVLVANRDEFHARATRPAQFREDAPAVLGGRDEVSGGSWLEFARHGRLAAVTNVRRPPFALRPRSRGELVSAFAAGAQAWPEFADAYAADAAQFGLFNLLAWDGRQLGYASNADGWRQHEVAPGLHALSNAGLDTPWPKALAARQRLQDWLDAGRFDAAALTALLDAFADRTPAADAALPDTGVGLLRERLLSPMFIAGADYGTRSTSLVLVGRDGGWRFVERRYGADALAQGESCWQGTDAAPGQIAG